MGFLATEPTLWRALYSAGTLLILLAFSGCYQQTSPMPPTRPSAAVEAFKAAEKAVAVGDLSTALIQAETAVKADPSYDEAAWLQASLLGRAGRLEEALAICKAITERSPDFVQAHLLEGILWDQSGDRDTANRCYDEVLRRFTVLEGADGLDNRTQLLQAFVVYLRKGELEGVKALNKYLLRFPEHPTAQYLKGCMQTKERGFLLRWFSEDRAVVGEIPAGIGAGLSAPAPGKDDQP